MAEWLKAHAWKACIRATVSWVRIPLPPPTPQSADVRCRSPEAEIDQYLSAFLALSKIEIVFTHSPSFATIRGYSVGTDVGAETFRLTPAGDCKMAKGSERLSDRTIRTAKPGMHADGKGLYLQVRESSSERSFSKTWIYRYAAQGIGRERYMGLGSYPDIGLATARARATDARKLREQQIDPIDYRDEQRAALKRADAEEKAKLVTFDECRDAYIDSHRSSWRNTKHAKQWTNTLKTYVTPVFGDLPVQVVDTGLVCKVLERMWTIKPETASRVRGRIEAILDWAKVREYRCGENPARWRGHLDHVLPARSKVRKVKHHAALPYSEIGAFMASLRERNATAARALEFTILTAARTGEVLGARRAEIDLASKVWTIPGERMKAGREHRVPLSRQAVALLDQLLNNHESEYVFPGEHRATLSNMAMDMLLRRMDSDVTVHGFRSTFRDWAADCTSFSNEVCEAALAHVIGNKAEAAYRRGDLFDKRRKLMEAWAVYCAAPKAGKVVELRRKRSGVSYFSSRI
jgi:integrase